MLTRVSQIYDVSYSLERVLHASGVRLKWHIIFLIGRNLYILVAAKKGVYATFHLPMFYSLLTRYLTFNHLISKVTIQTKYAMNITVNETSFDFY